MIFAADAVEVFFATNVVISRIGNSGEETYLPSNVTVWTVKSRQNKGWVVARNLAGNSLNFNAIIPGKLPVQANDGDRSIRFGKVPSLSYTNEKGKAIPTIWCFKFGNKKSYEAFYGLLLTFAALADAVNSLPLSQPLFDVPEEISQVVDEGATEETVDEATEATSGNNVSGESSTNEHGSVNLLNDSTDESAASYGSAASPVFAESQDIYASLGRDRDASYFSPLE